MTNNDRIYYSHDAETHANRVTLQLTVLCLVVGLGIGAVLALLFSPTTGKKVRDELTKTVEDGLHDGRKAAQPLVKNLEKDFDELQKNVEERLKRN